MAPCCLRPPITDGWEPGNEDRINMTLSNSAPRSPRSHSSAKCRARRSASLSCRLPFLLAIKTKLVIEQRFKGKSAAFLLPFQVVFHFLALFRFPQGANTERDLPLRGIDIDHFGFDFVADFEKAGRLVDAFRA